MRFSKVTFYTVLVIALFAQLAPGLKAQTGDDESAALKAKGEAEYAEADKLLDAGTVEGAKAALPKFKTAAEFFRRAGETAKQAEALLFAGRSAHDSGDIDTALPLYNEALQLFREVKGYEGEAAALNNIGFIFFSLSDMAKAREYYEQAEAVVTSHGISSLEALICGNLGTVYDGLGEKQKAVVMFRRSVNAAKNAADAVGEAYGLSNLGKVLTEMGDRKSALDFYEQVLTLARKYLSANLEINPNRYSIADLEITVLINTGTVRHYLGEYEKALVYYSDAERIIEASTEKQRLALVLNNIGQSKDALGEKETALRIYERALPLAEKNGEKMLQAAILNNIGLVYLRLQDRTRALGYFNRGLVLSRSIGDKSREAATLLNIGTVHQAETDYKEAAASFRQVLKITETTLDVRLEVTAFNNIGNIHLIAEQPKEALVFFERALPVARKSGDRDLEVILLNNIGRTHVISGDRSRAISFYNQSVTIARAIGDREGEAVPLRNLMDVWDEAGNRNVAIFFGKQAVNVYQSLRGNIKGLDTSVQRSYLESVEATYRKLAGLLIGASRIAEAEQVLTMLKKEELIEFVRGDDDISKSLLGSVALSTDERTAIARYGELADKITAIGAEFGELEIQRKQFAVGEFPGQSRYDELWSQLADASVAFEKFLEDLKIRYGQKDARVVQADAGLQKTLDRLKAHKTAAVATILGEKGIHIIVTTSKTQRAHFVPIEEEILGEMIAEMRSVLRSPRFDPRPASQAVYDLLVKPIEGDLAGIKADTIVWSLDGALRYIPPAALWTKDKGYLAERFANVVVSLASRETLALDAGNGGDWSVLGVGVSKATDGFDPLFAVPEELGCIVSDKGNVVTDKCTTGVLPGRRLLDDNFTLTRFEAEIGRYPVIHIASHFQLTPGDDKNSFLLLGGGSDRRFTVDRLRNQNLTDVDLIVLSACNTATPGGARSNGVEIEGFGSIAHEAGAKSVIATLWSVFDASTKDVMVEFYRGFRNGKISKAEGLRRAQIQVMNGQYKPTEGAAKRGAVLFDGGGENIPFKIDPQAPFAHPYYWSPFILMGNWR